MDKETEELVEDLDEKTCLTINKASLAEAIWEEHGIDRRDGKVFFHFYLSQETFLFPL